MLMNASLLLIGYHFGSHKIDTHEQMLKLLRWPAQYMHFW